MFSGYGESRIDSQRLVSFLEGSGYNDMEIQLLRFWGRHPQSKLSLYTIARALDNARVNLRHSITDLVRKGILKEQHNDNGLTTYTLTGDRRVREYIDQLGGLSKDDLGILRKQLEREAVPA